MLDGQELIIIFCIYSPTPSCKNSPQTYVFHIELRQPSGQGIRSWQACHELEPSSTKDPPLLSRHEGILNSRRAASSLESFVEEEEMWETTDILAGCSPSKLGWNRAKSQCHLCGAQSYG
ncbi:hypothetical protein TNCV_1344831 [Trichonephila clavipes]|nr:hypothetical protein TNCV_1344831 [Trichonephila clavipes]